MYIRVLNPDDAKIYREIRLQSLLAHPEAFLSSYEAEKDLPVEATRSRLEQTDGQFTLGGFSEKHELTGIVTFVRESRDKIRHKGNVYAMYISPAARKQKLGYLLMLELIEKSRRLPGMEIINLTVFSDNLPAIKLYTSLGFVRYGTERNAVKLSGKYLDEDLMSLTLTPALD
ncbi:GNAT family N-acetyltransferase [Paenibacillus sp. PK3_47]|uniref:GNAT family N-acetyltransferase n=1 Tax=Paenibacillus sp. PK3_47 TaxID=2072642 RepID=UPI00201D897B|nr:GNAT family N-acetyltransferase [Paenibacillus sp. PK3_47]UQZ35125.1 GNAT family N-acetyltransferase [Paenibacillus sp. PK3_47]